MPLYGPLHCVEEPTTRYLHFWQATYMSLYFHVLFGCLTIATACANAKHEPQSRVTKVYA